MKKKTSLNKSEKLLHNENTMSIYRIINPNLGRNELKSFNINRNIFKDQN